jgi:hypothetical protein
MTNPLRRNTPVIPGRDGQSWEARDPPMEKPLNSQQRVVLERIAEGQGLFRLLDDNLNPLYDFGPSEPIENELVDALLAVHAIQFDTVVGFRLPMRARLTSWGKALLDDAV